MIKFVFSVKALHVFLIIHHGINWLFNYLELVAMKGDNFLMLLSLFTCVAKPFPWGNQPLKNWWKDGYSRRESGVRSLQCNLVTITSQIIPVTLSSDSQAFIKIIWSFSLTSCFPEHYLTTRPFPLCFS